MFLFLPFSFQFEVSDKVDFHCRVNVKVERG